MFNLAYDDNGNLSTKTEQGGAGAVTNYSWDARNRLSGISAPGLTASFEYDALGRRSSKTVNGQSIGFVYDGAQAIGEVTGGTISTAILSTLAIDDVVARYTTQGTRTILVDALGSVIAQAKDDQSIQNYYGYSAYGEAQTLGPDEGNAIQYTGREVDGTGLMYYRARYYDAVLKRFVSEDPIGLAGGGNFYGYVGGNPVSRTDPMGLLFGGRVDAGESYAEAAAEYWADKSVNEGSPALAFVYDLAGVAASAWTPATSDVTAATLAGGCVGRVIGPFTTRSLPPVIQRIRQVIRYDRSHHGNCRASTRFVTCLIRVNRVRDAFPSFVRKLKSIGRRRHC